MTLLNAPEFNEKKEAARRKLWIGCVVAVVVIAIFAFTGFAMGHGWFFMNLPAEHKVGNLLAAVQAKDYSKAYGIFYNDPGWQQHPDKYKDYPLKRFTEDFSTESDWKGPITSYHVDCSKRDSTGVVVGSTINGTTPLTLKTQRSDSTISFYLPGVVLKCGL
ncbi:MAG TPA: hypothetical protein VN612_08885 [Acidobacteriaceae bacterium]|nr:hypothetical protein [Acidobacteriaceae bacterium]